MTETKVVDGSTVEITWTSTSTIVTQVKATQTVYTTSVATEYETTDVYTTVCLTLTLMCARGGIDRVLTEMDQISCPVTTYTTVSEGSTIKVTQTDT